MKTLRITTAVSCAVIAVAAPAHAEFLFGGDITIERDIESYGEPFVDYSTTLRGEVFVGYDTGDFAFGVGARFSEQHDDFELSDSNRFGFVRVGPVTVSHGYGYGAGGMVSEDYFALNDATARDVPMTRIDLALDNVHLAFSTDDGDDTEWGLSTMLGDYFLRAGYETDAKDLQIAVGRDMGGWGFHTVYHNDLDDSGSADQLAGTLLYDVSKSLRVAGSVAINGDRELDSYGLIAWYEFGEGVSSSFGPATLRLQYVDDINSDNKSIELAINLPFGNQAPSFYERNAKKEDYSGFGYY